MNTKAQAEAMTRGIVDNFSFTEKLGWKNFVKLCELISTALEKLLAENENLKNGWPHEQPLHDMPMDRQIVMLNRQLTATEARLNKDVEFYQAAMKRIAECFGITDPIQMIVLAENNSETYVDILVEKIIKPRLSTLTAEKKEEAK